MSATAKSAVIVCQGCERKFAWKPELAGKRVRCKCGHAIVVAGTDTTLAADPLVRTQPAAHPPAPTVRRPPVPAAPAKAARPASPKVVDEFDALAALAADAEQKAADLPLDIREDPTPTPTRPSTRQRAAAAVPGRPIPGRMAPLGYRQPSGIAEARKSAAQAAALTDSVRDQYAPAALLAVGTLVYAAFVLNRYHVSASSLTLVIAGLSVVVALKTALLVGGAFLLAGPLGVGFGDLKSAVLKLAAIAVCADAAADWVDYALTVGTGADGHHATTGIGFGFVGWFVSLGVYWSLMVYLFSMDITDARAVVVCLTVLGRVLRWVIILSLYGLMVGGGLLPSPIPSTSAAVASAPTIHASALATHVDDCKAADALVEAETYIAAGHQAVAKGAVDAWYAAGCPNVWYEMTGRDINGRRSAIGLIVQLPESATRRAKCYSVLNQYIKDLQGYHGTMGTERDAGESYMQAPM